MRHPSFPGCIKSLTAPPRIPLPRTTRSLPLLFPTALRAQGVILDYPKGGTEALVDALVRGVEGKGGRVMLAAHVEDVVVEDGKACGVRLRGGKVIRASR